MLHGTDTDIQTDRQTACQADIYTWIDTDIQTDRQTTCQADIYTSIDTDRNTDRQTGRHIYICQYRQTDKLSGIWDICYMGQIQTYIQTHRQTGKHM